jgi:general secretion pathway protein A
MNHRLKIAGATRKIFDDSVIKIIYDQSGGIPRRINQICDMALLTGFGKQAQLINEDIVMEVVRDLES